MSGNYWFKLLFHGAFANLWMIACFCFDVIHQLPGAFECYFASVHTQIVFVTFADMRHFHYPSGRAMGWRCLGRFFSQSLFMWNKYCTWFSWKHQKYCQKCTDKLTQNFTFSGRSHDPAFRLNSKSPLHDSSNPLPLLVVHCNKTKTKTIRWWNRDTHRVHAKYLEQFSGCATIWMMPISSGGQTSNVHWASFSK